MIGGRGDKQAKRQDTHTESEDSHFTSNVGLILTVHLDMSLNPLDRRLRFRSKYFFAVDLAVNKPLLLSFFLSAGENYYHLFILVIFFLTITTWHET